MPQREDSHRRKLDALLRVMLFLVPISVVAHLLRRDYPSAGTTGAMELLLLLAWRALRRKAPVAVIGLLVFVPGVTLAVVMAIGAGVNGEGALTWIILAPVMAMGVGGRKAGAVALPISLAAIGVGLWGIHEGWAVPHVQFEGTSVPHVVGLVCVCVATFLLVRSYDAEAQAHIDQLEAQNRALLEAQAEVERASRAKEQFLATISHELRTPLHGVTGMIDLLRTEKDPARQQEELRLLQHSADMLLAVINDVLDYSKLDSQKVQLESTPLSLAHEVGLVVELIRPRAVERGNTLHLELDPGAPPWVLGDPTRVRQVVLNLLSNAAKFTTKGAIRCSVRRDGQVLRIQVADTGIGMSEVVQQKLFAPFVQADASTTRRFGGTGLGLVISRRLIDAMGGAISVESQAGLGSRFTISLPCRETTPPPPAPHEAARSEPVARRVLVVEDNAINQTLVVRLLERSGHRVAVAENGARGLEALAQERFDLVLMDCHMPEMDGFEATRRLRSRGDRTPVWALTAGVSSDDRQLCLEAGMDGILSKPLRVERLAEVLGSLPSGS